MCGIAGIYRTTGLTSKDIKDFYAMMFRCQRRGSHATGAFNQNGEFVKAGMKASDLAVTRNFIDFVKGSKGCKYIIGHCRMSTRGTPKVINNDHPVVNKGRNVFLVHNGTVNCEEYDRDKSATDTWVFMNGIEEVLGRKDRSDGYLSRAVKESFVKICDLAKHNSSVIVVGNRKEIVFAKSDDKPLVWQVEEDTDGSRVVFGSETTIVHSRNDMPIPTKPYNNLKNYTMITIKMKTGEIVVQDLDVKSKAYCGFDREKIFYDDDEPYTGGYGYGNDYVSNYRGISNDRGNPRWRRGRDPHQTCLLPSDDDRLLSDGQKSCITCTAYEPSKDTETTFEMERVYCTVRGRYVDVFSCFNCDDFKPSVGY